MSTVIINEVYGVTRTKANPRTTFVAGLRSINLQEQRFQVSRFR